MKIANTKQINEIENKTINYLGLDSLILMERAGLESYNFIKNKISLNDNIFIISGTGNNGADSLVLARLMFLAGYNIEIITIGEENKRTAENKKQLNLVKKLNISINQYNSKEFENILNKKSLIVDGIFGIGLKRDIEHDYFSLINTINHSEIKILSLDIPSGINANTGKVLNIAIKADYTVTYGFIKVGLLMDQALDYVGILKCVDIGIPKFYADDLKINLIEKSLINQIHLKPRKKNSFKNKYGKTLLIGGSLNMSGAIILSAKSALKSGTGLVYILTEEINYSIVATQIPTAMTHYHINKVTKEIKDLILSVDTIIFGPGMDFKKFFYTELLKFIVKNFNKKLVIDAGGLSILAQNNNLLKNPKSEIILTPHAGELSKLMSLKSEDIQSDRIGSVESFLESYKKVVLVLKGAKTIIANKEKIYINSTGNPILARGGSGDILSGIIGAFCSLGINILDSAILGNYIQGLAGDIALNDYSENSIITEELIEYISKAFKLLEIS